MVPFLVLVVVTCASRLIGLFGAEYVSTWVAALAVGLAAMFLTTATSHFIEPRRSGLVAIVPPRIPYAGAVVTLTGALEVLGAIGLLLPPVRQWAAACLAVLLCVMLPANVYASKRKRHPHAPSTPLPQRLLLQALFLAACVAVALPMPW